MRVMSVDPGKRRSGVALSDGLGLTARPLTTLDKKQTPYIVGELMALIRAHEVARVVVGLPLEQDGNVGPSAKRALHLRGKLEEALEAAGLAVQVVSLDEAYTTTEAYARLKARGIEGDAARAVVDEEAAAVILESYLRVLAAEGAAD